MYLDINSKIISQMFYGTPTDAKIAFSNLGIKALNHISGFNPYTGQMNTEQIFLEPKKKIVVLHHPHYNSEKSEVCLIEKIGRKWTLKSKVIGVNNMNQLKFT